MENVVARDLCKGLDTQFNDYLVVGIADHPCTRCGGSLFLTVPDTAQSIQGASLLCSNEAVAQPIHDASFAVQQLVEDRLRSIYEGSGLVEASRRLATVLNQGKVGSHPAPRPTAAVEPSTAARTSSVDVPIPSGFRTVSWIRQHEAELIASSYDNQRAFTLTGDDGSPVFETQFFALDSPEAIRFKAQVLGVRHRKNGTRNLGWIRREEANAVLQAYDEQRSIDFLHTSFGRGGRVEFFGADSDAARTYRSQTRLLRRNA